MVHICSYYVVGCVVRAKTMGLREQHALRHGRRCAVAGWLFLVGVILGTVAGLGKRSRGGDVFFPPTASKTWESSNKTSGWFGAAARNLEHCKSCIDERPSTAGEGKAVQWDTRPWVATKAQSSCHDV